MEKLRSRLEELVALVEPIVSSGVDAWVAEIVEFACHSCHEPTGFNRLTAGRRPRIECVHCGAAHYLSGDAESGEMIVELEASRFPCAVCGHENPVENRLLQVGLEFTCGECGRIHQVVQRAWDYRLMPGDREEE